MSEDVQATPELAQLLAAIADGESQLIVGAPGSGKTTLLASALTSLLEQPEAAGFWTAASFVTADRRRATETEGRVGAKVLGAVQDPGGHRVIRSLTSFAYLVISHWLIERRNPQPRPALVGGAEEELWLTNWLQEHADQWGQHLPPESVESASLVTELRSLLARAGEMGVMPQDLAQLGREAGQPVWELAAQAYAAYAGDEEAMSVDSPHIDAARAPLVAARLIDAWQEDAATAGVLSPPPLPRVLLVDDLQEFPASAAILLQSLARAGVCVVAAWSPLSATTAYRGGQADLGDWLRTAWEGLERAVSSAQGRSHGADRKPRLGEIVLGDQWRQEPPLAQAAQAAADWVTSQGAPGQQFSPSKSVRTLIGSAPGRTGTLIADALRSRHLLDGVPWSQQALIVRSAASIEPLRRTLRRKGVPLAPSARMLPLAQLPAASQLLRLLASPSADASEEDRFAEAMQLLTSPLVGADRLQLYRYLREITAPDERLESRLLQLLAASAADDADAEDELVGSSVPGGSEPAGPEPVEPEPTEPEPAEPEPAEPEPVESGPTEPTPGGEAAHAPQAGPYADVQNSLARAAAIWRAREAAAELGASAGLWQLWEAADRAEAWREAALRGGVSGELADEHLDGALALFRRADLWEQQQMARAAAGASVEATARLFADAVLAEEIPSDSIATGGKREPGVEILTPTAAAGRQWDTVIVADLEDGLWPGRGRLGGTLQLSRLESLFETVARARLAGGARIGSSADRSAADFSPARLLSPDQLSQPVDGRTQRQVRRQEEARLFISALTRPTSQLYLAATESEDTALSPFLQQLARQDVIPPVRDAQGSAALTPNPPVMDLPSLTGSLRAATTEGQTAQARSDAARLLAVLASAGVAGADPARWVGAGSLSSASPILEPGELTLSPSRMQTANECLLYWFLTSIGGDDLPGLLQVTAPGKSEMGTLLHQVAEELPHGPTADLLALIEQRWAEMSPDDGTWWWQRTQAKLLEMGERLGRYMAAHPGEVETELSFDAHVGGARVRGRIDRVEQTDEGQRIVDIKSGKTPPKLTLKSGTETNFQLALYQLALEQGSDSPVTDLALLPLGTTTKRDMGGKSYGALSDDDRTELQDHLTNLAGQMLGPTYTPTPGDACSYCRLVSVCPAKETGSRGIE